MALILTCFFFSRRWRGSIYKLLWQEFLIFAALYTILAVAYQIFMEGDDKK